MVVGVTYKGVSAEDLTIEAIRWSVEAAQHMRTRTDRYGPDETNIEPEWATEAALDPNRLIGLRPHQDPATASLAVIGRSTSMPPGDRVLKVWVWTDDPTDDLWEGASASLANKTDQRRYEEGI